MMESPGDLYLSFPVHTQRQGTRDGQVWACLVCACHAQNAGMLTAYGFPPEPNLLEGAVLVPFVAVTGVQVPPPPFLWHDDFLQESLSFRVL